MKSLSCKQLKPDADCDFTATGETNEEVISQIFEHANVQHPDMIVAMSDEEKEDMKAKMNEMLDAQA